MSDRSSFSDASSLPEGFARPGTLDGPFTVRDEPSWVDLDALGHINHAVYLRFFENARMKYFRSVGIEGLSLGAGIGPILATTTVNYRCPVRFPDELLVRTSCVRIGRTSFTLEGAIWSKEERQICADGSFVIVLLDYQDAQRPTPVPEAVRAAMRALDPSVTES